MEHIGTALARVTGTTTDTDQTGSVALSPRPLQGPPTTMNECRALAQWAEALPLMPLQPASDNFVVNRLRFMQATLPARVAGDDTGELRTSVYVSILRGKSRAALTYLADRACRDCRWFPTPAECEAILADHREPESERSATLRVCAQFATDALRQWIANLDQGGEIGDVSEQWQRIAVEEGKLRRLEDGSLVVRSRYHGPIRAIA